MKAFLSLFFLLRFAAGTLAQSTDTLAEARALAYAGQFDAAATLLAHFEGRDADVEALRLHAEVLYWGKHYRRARRLYRAALRTYPDDLALQLEYARLLVGLDRRRAARRLLNNYLRHEPSAPEARVLLARLDYYDGHPGRARTAARRLHGYAPARTLLTEIERATAPFATVRTGYQRDDQPLQSTAATARAGVYRSWLLEPRVEAAGTRFLPPNSPAVFSAVVRAGNTVRLEPFGLAVQVSTGFFKHRLDAGPAADWIGRAALTQRLPVRHLFAELSAAREPYQYTAVAATRLRVLTNAYRAGLRYEQGDRWLAQAAGERQEFGDTNHVRTVYAWAMGRLFHRTRFGVQLGYGFSYASSKRNSYGAVQSLPRLLAAYPATIEGHYGAYFTPTDQTIHRLLAAVHARPARRLTASARVSHGIYAEAANPYLYLDHSAGDVVYVRQAFSPRRFTPTEAHATLTWEGRNGTSVGLDYTYSELFFYTAQQAGAHFTCYLDARK